MPYPLRVLSVSVKAINFFGCSKWILEYERLEMDSFHRPPKLILSLLFQITHQSAFLAFKGETTKVEVTPIKIELSEFNSIKKIQHRKDDGFGRSFHIKGKNTNFIKQVNFFSRQFLFLFLVIAFGD